MASGGVKSFYRQKKRGVGKAAASSSKSTKAALALAVAEKAAAPASLEEEEAQTLQRFDLDMRYGPCIGISRMQRWDRAAAMGLNPPAEVVAIIAKSVEAAAESIWNGRI